MVRQDSREDGRGAAVLAVTFATTVGMWTLLYVAAMPPGHPVVWGGAALAIIVCLFAGGFVLGRFAGLGAAGGMQLGGAVAVVNMLILLSLLGGGGEASRRHAAVWIIGFAAAAIVLGALGAAFGRREALPGEVRRNWTAMLAWVTAITTLLMLIAGGIVTGLEAGLAVDGWLVAEGHLLVLFPITLMQRDVSTFVEHAHRLWGLLVGLTTIVLAARLWLVEPRPWLRWLSVGVVLAVIVQGVLGGTRVTERSVALAIAHGVFAQVILATLVVMALACSTAWRSASEPVAHPSAGTDRTLGAVLLAAIVFQITLGTLFRHLQPEPGVPRGALIGLLHGHSFIGSSIVAVLVVFCGMRAWGIYTEQPAVTRSGKRLIHTLGLQVALGIGSFIVVPKGPRDPEAGISAVEVALTTAHQAVGAVLLAVAAVLVAWERRSMKRAISHKA